jgi:Na+-translocating ferredoxin:NAD+ oxidoreductase RnfD subunit
MEFSLKGALKKHRRMRSWREVVVLAALPISFGGSWFFDFGRTDTLIAAAIACVFAGLSLSGQSGRDVLRCERPLVTRADILFTVVSRI